MTIHKPYYYLLIISGLFLCGCAVHQWPEPKWTFPNTIHLQFESDFWLWEHYYDPNTAQVVEIYPDSGVDAQHPGTSGKYTCINDFGTMRYVVRAFRPNDRYNSQHELVFMRDISSAQNYDCDFALNIPEGDYEVAVWADLVEDVNDVPHYDASDFYSIELLSENYKANSDLRDAYRGLEQVEIQQLWTRDESMKAPEPTQIIMRRPMAKFEFVTTDLSEFLDRETVRRRLSTRARADEYVVLVSYSSYLPNKYNLFDDRTGDAARGVSFESQMTLTGESEASMGFDYVIINAQNIISAQEPSDQVHGVEAQIYVFDMAGSLVAQSQKIMVPLRRNHHTILRGAFLSQMAQGGVEIDPSYDGDHNLFFGKSSSSRESNLK